MRVRPAHHDEKRSRLWPEQWLLIEWPEGAPEPTKYWLSNLAADTGLERLVYLAKLRWLIEKDYRELKQELGEKSELPEGLDERFRAGWPQLETQLGEAATVSPLLIPPPMISNLIGRSPPREASQTEMIKEPIPPTIISKPCPLAPTSRMFRANMGIKVI